MRNFATLTQMMVFVKIAESRSLSAAGRELSLSPSAVSKTLAQLEARLGVLLVKRTTSSLTLTESGQIFLQRATALLADVDGAMDCVRQFGKPEGELKLTSSIAFGSMQLASLLGKFLEFNPKVKADLILDDRYVKLKEEDFDIALRITSNQDWDYAGRPLASIRWIYCASPVYLERHRPIEEPEDISRHDCLIYPTMTLGGEVDVQTW
ncbi:LysR family transcriptional regulator [Achromobacter xylosoxidans]|uniref:LysR family transcriptional regulator n=1 Tax=Alcaligenes xylosoxydans xylosoxydans TaxID=85698 RepID=UPI0024026E6A|nr:LysR family transcriptional regulator [Achromobacter xylosoxidans]